MHHLPSLFSNCSQHFKIVSNTITRHHSQSLFHFCFSAVPNTTRMHHLPSLFSFHSLQFQIVLNNVTMHAVGTLFSPISPQFKIVSNTVRMYASKFKGLCNKYILNTERKVFTYLRLNYVVEGLHYFKEEYLF